MLVSVCMLLWTKGMPQYATLHEVLFSFVIIFAADEKRND